MNKRYLLIPEQPLLISGSSTGNYLSTLDFVPGSAMRGALVSTLIQQYGKKDGYQHYVDAGAPIFSHAYPTDTRDSNPRPFPVTAVTGKRHPGFFDDNPSQPAFGITDMMLVQWLKLQEALEATEEEVTAHSGYYYQPTRPGERSYYPADDRLRTQVTTHVGINRRRHVAEDGLLYSREGLVFENNHGFFIGQTNLSDAAAEALHGITIFIGGSRSRGMGRCRLEIEEMPAEPREVLLNRCRRFSRDVGDILHDLDHPKQAEDSDFFTLDTLTPFVPDPMQSYQPAPMIPQATLEHTWTRIQEMAGWHSAAGLPRTSYQAYHATWLYRTDDLTAVIDTLHAIQQHGAGQQRDRGFGRFRICDAFHLDGFNPKTMQLKGVNQ